MQPRAERTRRRRFRVDAAGRRAWCWRFRCCCASSFAVLWRSPDASAARAVLVSPPTVAQPTVTLGPGSATVSWTATPGSGGAIESYVVTAYDLLIYSDVTSKTVSAADAGPPTGTTFIYTGLSNNRRYSFTVTAVDANGAGDPSTKSTAVMATSVEPFFNSAECIQRQYADLLGVVIPSPTRFASWTKQIDTYGRTCAWVAQQFWLSGGFQDVVPSMTRLYQAYFLRIPDYGGLNYWIGRNRAGQSPSSISGFFAGSTEFKKAYGANISNGAFLKLVYGNVLGRSPDPSGYNYWLKLMNAHKIGRGSVMLLFSDSAEYKSTQNPRIKAEMLYVEMLRRKPTAAEVLASAATMPNRGSSTAENSDLLAEVVRIMSSAEYRQRAHDAIIVN